MQIDKKITIILYLYFLCEASKHEQIKMTKLFIPIFYGKQHFVIPKHGGIMVDMSYIVAKAELKVKSSLSLC